MTIDKLERWARGHTSEIVLGCSLALLCAALIASGSLLYDQRQHKIEDYAVSQNQPTQVTRRASGPSIERAVNAHLFGNPAPMIAQQAPTTTLDLKLEGVLSATTPALARAIIKSGGKSSRLYKIGDQVAGAGASIEEIRRTEVLLNRSGAIESLPLSKNLDSRGANIQFNNVANSNQTGSRKVASFDTANMLSRSGSAAPRVTGQVAPKPNSENGERRRIKRPSFSGVDRAIKKRDDL